MNVGGGLDCAMDHNGVINIIIEVLQSQVENKHSSLLFNKIECPASVQL